MQGGDEVAFVTAGGFADDMRSRQGSQEFDQPAVARRRVGQVVAASEEVQLQVKLGNIQACVDRGHGVLAPSCKSELAGVGPLHQRFEFRTPARTVQALHALGPKPVPEANELIRATVLPPAGGRTVPSSPIHHP